MAVPLDAIGPYKYKIGHDLTKTLEVTKYEPQVKGSPQQGTQRATPQNANPNFNKYTSINHLKNYPTVLAHKTVVVFEKIHGTNFRAGWVKQKPRNWWDHVKKHFGCFPEYQFVYGSHNVQLQDKYGAKTGFYYAELGNVYARTVYRYNLISKLQPGEVMYGEIYGPGIQKGYSYGVPDGEIRMRVIDLKKDGQYVGVRELSDFCYTVGLNMAPLIYAGPFQSLLLDKVTSGCSLVDRSQEVREGIVIRTREEETGHMGRMIFKNLNPEYLLLKDQTEHH
jgi:RNA ligase (TIGR02306 family)